MSILLTPGQAGDNPQLLPLLDQIAVRPRRARPAPQAPRPGAGRQGLLPPLDPGGAARARDRVHQPRDGATRSPAARAKGSRGGRPPAFDPELYADRNVVERCFNRLKQFRDLATRYAKRAAYYRSEIIIAAIVLWLRTDLQDTP